MTPGGGAGRRLRQALRRPPTGRGPDPGGPVDPADLELVLGSGIVDAAWVAHQTGLPVADDAAAAARACLEQPRVSPHPLFWSPWVRNGPGPSPEDDEHPLVWFLRHPDVQRACSTHPAVDPERVAVERPDVAGWLADLGPDDRVPSPGALTDPSYDVLRRAAHDAVASTPTTTGTAPAAQVSVAVVVVVRGNLPAVLEDLLEAVAEPDARLTLVTSGLAPWQHACLAGLAACTTQLRLVGDDATDPRLTDLLALGLDGTHDGPVVLCQGPGLVGARALRALGLVLADETVAVAQPVVLAGNGTVSSAGAVLATPLPHPVPFLSGHATADLAGLGEEPLELPATWGPVLAARGTDLRRVGSSDAPLDDAVALTALGAHLAAHGRCVLVPTPVGAWRPPALPDDDSLAALYDHLDTLPERAATPGDALWHRVGLEPVGLRSRPLREEPPGEVPLGVVRVVHPVLRPVRAHVEESPPRLRWAIDTPAPAGPTGRSWGDLHFAESLAVALRDLGQHVAVDRRNARHRWSRDLDDVLLVLRGKHRVLPWPTTTNLLWVISHPDEVTAAEAASYDRVLAAGPAWAARVSREWGLPVDPLLQATDPARFAPLPELYDTGDPLLFVGNSRQVFRHGVRLALDADRGLAVHGDGWDGLLPAGTLRSRYVPNDRLGAAYAAAGVVLNDHWDAMRESGFVSNRLMDAAAVGARVATDEVAVEGLEDLFGGLVRTYRAAEDLRDLVDRRHEHFPNGPARVDAAERVRAEHSFAARARVLLDTAVEQHARRSER